MSNCINLHATTETKLKVKKLENKKIAIASDHAGFYLKEKLLAYLIREKYDVKDFGTSSPESVDYPDFGHPLANAVSCRRIMSLGISICGTGNGINMVVNKHPGIRAALCWNEEIAGCQELIMMQIFLHYLDGLLLNQKHI